MSSLLSDDLLMQIYIISMDRNLIL